MPSPLSEGDPDRPEDDLPEWLRDGRRSDSQSKPQGSDGGWLGRFPVWRRLMLGGAVLLLIVAIGAAAMDDFPQWIVFAANVIGFLLLAAGFGEAMRARRKG